MPTLSTTEKVRIFGLPGEEQKMLVYFGTTEFPLGSRPISVPGYFRVQFLLARPGHLKFTEENPSFLGSLIGDSHIGTLCGPDITEPGWQKLRLFTKGDNWNFAFECVTNADGKIGKIIAENVYASNYLEAEAVAYRALAPFLSSWSVTLDIPVVVETIQVTDLTTHTEMLRIKAPYEQMIPGSGTGRNLSEEFRNFASIYREAMNAESAFYRFLCFYKVIESIYFLRSKKAAEAKARGEEPRKYTEDIPLTREGVEGILRWLYPWRTERADDMLLDQLLPNDAAGIRFKALRHKHLEALRNRIAHGLMRSGEIQAVADRIDHLQEATKWIPLLRLWSRLLLKIEFPSEFGL